MLVTYLLQFMFAVIGVQLFKVNEIDVVHVESEEKQFLMHSLGSC